MARQFDNREDAVLRGTADLPSLPIGTITRWTLPNLTLIMIEVQGGFSFRLRRVVVPDSLWDRFWKTEPEWLVLWIAVLAILLVIAWYVVGKIRPNSSQKERRASQWLTKFREAHSQGELSDEEFRTIKTQLAEQLQDELNSSDKGK